MKPCGSCPFFFFFFNERRPGTGYARFGIVREQIDCQIATPGSSRATRFSTSPLSHVLPLLRRTTKEHFVALLNGGLIGSTRSPIACRETLLHSVEARVESLINGLASGRIRIADK